MEGGREDQSEAEEGRGGGSKEEGLGGAKEAKEEKGEEVRREQGRGRREETWPFLADLSPSIILHAKL